MLSYVNSLFPFWVAAPNDDFFDQPYVNRDLMTAIQAHAAGINKEWPPLFLLLHCVSICAPW